MKQLVKKFKDDTNSGKIADVSLPFVFLINTYFSLVDKNKHFGDIDCKNVR